MSAAQAAPYSRPEPVRPEAGTDLEAAYYACLAIAVENADRGEDLQTLIEGD